MDEKFVELYSQLKMKDLANVYNVSEPTVRKWAQALNLPPKLVRKNLSGQTFNEIYVIEDTGKRFQGNTIYRCKCNRCGCIKDIRATSLKIIKTCGCGIKTGHKDISGKFWNNIIRNAKARDIEFDIKLEDAWEMLQKQNFKCAVSGVTISVKNKDRNASIDRKDSKKHYTIGNIQWVHKTVNMMKWKLTEEEFLKWCKIIAEYKKDN